MGKNEETETFCDSEEIVSNENINTEQRRKLRPGNMLKPPDWYFANLSETEIPSCYEEAMRNNHKIEWEKIKSELDSLKENDTWKKAELPPNKIPITSKWMFKIKRNPDGTVSKNKARLVWSKARHWLFRNFFTNNKETHFLHGNIEEGINMLPQGLAINSGKVKTMNMWIKASSKILEYETKWCYKTITFSEHKGWYTCVYMYTGTIENEVIILAILSKTK